MLSNFTGKKSDKEGQPVSINSAMTGPPGLPPNMGAGQARPGQTSTRVGERGAPSVIGPDLVINGNLQSRGEVQIDGEVQGDLHAVHIVVGEKAKITGGIVADEVVVRGHVMGSIRGKKVMLQSSSHVEGDVFHQTLSIEQGAFFEGKSRRSDDPLAAPGQRSDNVPAPIPLPAAQ